MFSDAPRGIALAEDLARRADASGDVAGAALARAAAGPMLIQTGRASSDEVERLAREALPLLEAAGDHAGLVAVWLALGGVANIRSRYEEWAQATEQAIAHARAAGSPYRTWGLGVALSQGPRPASEALATLDEFLHDSPAPHDVMLRGVLLAMLDRIDEAWAVALPAYEHAREIGWLVGSPFVSEIAAIAGDDATAAAYLREFCDTSEAAGNSAVLSTYAPLLGRTLCALGRYEEAEPLAAKGRALGEPEDVLTQAVWRQTEALLQAHRGDDADAERLAREAGAHRTPRVADPLQTTARNWAMKRGDGG